MAIVSHKPFIGVNTAAAAATEIPSHCCLSTEGRDPARLIVSILDYGAHDADAGAPSSGPALEDPEAPIRAAGFNNEFGRPALLGYFRTLEVAVA